MVNRKKQLASSVQFSQGITLLGAKLSLKASKNNEIEITALGVKATSHSTNRVVLIPWHCVNGIELIKNAQD